MFRLKLDLGPADQNAIFRDALGDGAEATRKLPLSDSGKVFSMRQAPSSMETILLASPRRGTALSLAGSKDLRRTGLGAMAGFGAGSSLISILRNSTTDQWSSSCRAM